MVGGKAHERGVVSAASYAVRKFGVHSAMPLREAYRRCPQAIFIEGSPAKYREYSRKARKILKGFSPSVEMASIDEAYLDMTGCERLLGPPLKAAHDLHEAVRAETGLPCSLGIGCSRLTAKIGSGLAKPNGILRVMPGAEAAFLAPLDIARIPGVGKTMQQKLRRLGIRKIGQIAQQDAGFLADRFGKAGLALAGKARGKTRAPGSARRSPTARRPNHSATKRHSAKTRWTARSSTPPWPSWSSSPRGACASIGSSDARCNSRSATATSPPSPGRAPSIRPLGWIRSSCGQSGIVPEEPAARQAGPPARRAYRLARRIRRPTALDRQGATAEMEPRARSGRCAPRPLRRVGGRSGRGAAPRTARKGPRKPRRIGRQRKSRKNRNSPEPELVLGPSTRPEREHVLARLERRVSRQFLRDPLDVALRPTLHLVRDAAVRFDQKRRRHMRDP